MRLRQKRQDQGAVLVTSALLMIALFLIIALVIDHGMTRSDRRGGQEAADNAAVAAGITLASTNAASACLDALDYLRISLEADPFDTSSCASTFGAACDPTTEKATPVITSGDFSVEVVHPVLNGSPLLNRASIIGGGDITSSTDDGLPCDRIAVRVVSNSSAYFGGITGQPERRTTVHAVARTSFPTKPRALNLLVLERWACHALSVQGTGTVIVDAYEDPEDLVAPYNLLSGIVASDSLGSDIKTCKTGTTLSAGGTAKLRADGPCLVDATKSCEGNGRLPVFAPFKVGDCSTSGDAPACSEDGVARITPDVEISPERYTRAPIDYRYNCKTDYSGERWYKVPLSQDIPPCSKATASSAFIDSLAAFVGTGKAAPSSDWIVTGGPKDKGDDPCKPAAPLSLSGNVYVDCDLFNPAAAITFSGGNVIFKGGISLSTGGSISINSGVCAVPPCVSAVSNTAFVGNHRSQNAAWTWVGGPIGMSAGTFTMEKTMMYMSDAASINMTGGFLDWSPPSEGPFDDLALWSASEGAHKFTGGGTLDLVGTYFAGEALLEYIGGANQVLDRAQFVANRLSFGGDGELRMSPDPGATKFEATPTANLIR